MDLIEDHTQKSLENAGLMTLAVIAETPLAQIDITVRALADRCDQLVDQADGATQLSAAARALMSRIPSSRGTSDDLLVIYAAAILRVVAEVEKDEDGGLRTLRLDHDMLWLSASDNHGHAVKALGEAANELAQRPSGPGPGEAARAFTEAVEGTPLSTLPTERLADIAASASKTAARSARLEIYLIPRRRLSPRAPTSTSSSCRTAWSSSRPAVRSSAPASPRPRSCLRGSRRSSGRRPRCRARERELALGTRLGVTPTPFDRLLVTQIREQLRLGGVKREDVIHDADRQGRAGPARKNLLRLVERAADAVAQSLLPARTPLLLIQPGLIARYRLDAFVKKLLQSPREAPIFVLVPGHDRGGIPNISGEYAIPGLLSSQVLWVSLEWLANQHNRAA